MTRIRISMVVLLLAVIPSVASAGQGEDLISLVEAYYDAHLELNPIEATYIGDHRFDDRFVVDIGPEYLDATFALETDYLALVEAIDPAELNTQDRLTREMFLRARRQTLDGWDFPGHLLPVNQFHGMPQLLAALGSGESIQPFETPEDYDAWVSRARGFAPWVDQAIANLRQGMADGVVLPKELVKRTLPQLKNQVVKKPEHSAFWFPVAAFPDSLPDEDYLRVEAAYRELIMNVLVPAYDRLYRFLKDEYEGRETFGLGDLPGGREWYAYLVRTQTGSDLTPEEIHELGKREVARLDTRIAGLEKVAEDKDKGYPNTKTMLRGFEGFRIQVKPNLVKLFRRIPRTDFEIRFTPRDQQETSAGAYYVAGSPDGTRPGVFFLNARIAKRYTQGQAEALYLHEAVPGHHFQISLARELENLPRFRRFGQHTAYAEGWGLYAESLGKPLGLYRNPEQEASALRSERFRAVRLVVDTGIHARGWSRDKARDWVDQNEADRYAAMPGQALAYKMGQMKILELRAMAEKELGGKFRMKDFHQAILGSGEMPLDLLEKQVRAWVESSR